MTPLCTVPSGLFWLPLLPAELLEKALVFWLYNSVAVSKQL